MIVLVLLFFGICLWHIKIAGHNQNFSQSFFDYDSTRALRGILALEIVLGHIGKYLGNYIVLKPFQEAGILAVGIFFLLSGYGLMTNLVHKDYYLNKFLSKHLLKILIPAYIVYLLKLPELIIIESMNWKDIVAYFFGKQMLTLTNWYVWEILFLYIIFYILYKNFSYKSATYILAVVSIIFVGICYLLGVKAVWYASTFNFLLGIIFVLKREQVISFLKVNTWVKLVASLFICGVFILLFLFLPMKTSIGLVFKNVICRNVSSLFFSISLMFAFMKIQIVNKITLFLGRISFELYLIHFIFLSIFHSVLYIRNDYLYACGVLTCSIMAAYFLNRLLRKSK